MSNVSTFSIDADGASYTIMRKYVKNGWAVEPASVRIEEFLNYFTFDYPETDLDPDLVVRNQCRDRALSSGIRSISASGSTETVNL